MLLGRRGLCTSLTYGGAAEDILVLREEELSWSTR